MTIHMRLGLPRWLSGKESACHTGDAGDGGLIPGLGRSPGGGHGNPLQYSCLENPHGQRSLEGCSPWGCTESDMTECACTFAPEVKFQVHSQARPPQGDLRPQPYQLHVLGQVASLPQPQALPSAGRG